MTISRKSSNTLVIWNITLFFTFCFCLSIASGQDIKLKKVPQSVQNTIRNEVGDMPIDDIDQDEDDGKIEYEINAKKEIKLKVAEDGTLLEKEEEISFYELPKLVKRTLRDIFGQSWEIDDIKLKTVNEKSFYNIDIEVGDDDVEIDVTPDGRVLKQDFDDDDDKNDLVIVEAKLAAKSKSPTLEDIAPYREALVVYEYDIQRRILGDFKNNKIRVLHWAIYDEQPQNIQEMDIGSKVRLKLRPFSDFNELETVFTSDTLDFDIDIPLYHDVGQKILFNQSVEERYDYRCGLSDKMPAFWLLKDQLKLVVLGDSRGLEGVRTELLYGEENRTTPLAFNLSVSSAPLEFQEILVKEYLLKMPKLEWVVYQMSPRVVNRHYNSDKHKKLQNSPGFDFDRKHADKLWQESQNTEVTVGEISSMPYVSEAWDKRPWGWKSEDDFWDNPEIDDDERKGEWRISEKRMDKLESLIQALETKGVRMLIYISPIHPIIRELPVVDDDGTTKEGYQQLVKRLNKLENKYPNLVFVDLLKGGNHEFAPEFFADLDHLNESGATKLTKALNEVIKAVFNGY